MIDLTAKLTYNKPFVPFTQCNAVVEVEMNKVMSDIGYGKPEHIEPYRMPEMGSGLKLNRPDKQIAKSALQDMKEMLRKGRNK